MKEIYDIRQQIPQCGDAGPSMRHADGRFRLEAMFDRPATPYARHRWSGVDQNSIHIEEQRLTCNLNQLADICALNHYGILTGLPSVALLISVRTELRVLDGANL